MLTKQAKMLTAEQLSTVEAHVATLHEPIRDTAILYLSFYAGLRACEIAGLTWDMVLDAQGNIASVVAITNDVAKGHTGGRVVPMHPKLATVLRQLTRGGCFPREAGEHVITSRSRLGVSPHYIAKRMKQWYAAVGLQGCSSHSGRRTFITTAARTINLHGGSLRDVQRLAGHAFLSTTERYIVENNAAQASVVASMA